jgi:hypothetical protein
MTVHCRFRNNDIHKWFGKQTCADSSKQQQHFDLHFDHATLIVSHGDMLEYKFYDRSVASKGWLLRHDLTSFFRKGALSHQVCPNNRIKLQNTNISCYSNSRGVVKSSALKALAWQCVVRFLCKVLQRNLGNEARTNQSLTAGESRSTALFAVAFKVVPSHMNIRDPCL